jgi:hypothetical protein
MNLGFKSGATGADIDDEGFMASERFRSNRLERGRKGGKREREREREGKGRPELERRFEMCFKLSM